MLDNFPGFSAVATGVHRQRSADRAGYTRKKLRSGQTVQGSESRYFRACHARAGVYQCAIFIPLLHPEMH